MTRRGALRAARRLGRRALQAVAQAAVEDPATGERWGALEPHEAIASGRALVGAHTYGDYRVRVGPGEPARLQIGAYCSIGAGAQFSIGGNHRTDWVSTYPFRVRWAMPGAYADGHPPPERDIVVGSDVWIGSEALILPGVTIGDGAVVGARAVVARDVRPYAIVVGSPAREVRRRFGDEHVQALLELRWWDWPEERGRANVELLCSPDVEALIALGRVRGGGL